MENIYLFLCLMCVGLYLTNINVNAKTLKVILIKICIPILIVSSITSTNINSNSYTLIGSMFIISSLSFALWNPLSRFIYAKDEKKKNVAQILTTSLAPFLSLMPLLLIFQPDLVGLAAIADTANKGFIFFVLFPIIQLKVSGGRIDYKSLFIEFVSKPTSIAVILGIILNIAGFNLSEPEQANVLLSSASLLVAKIKITTQVMVPIYIGLSINIKENMLEVLRSLLAKSGVFFLCTSLTIIAGQKLGIGEFYNVGFITILTVFPQSSCSFIPVAKIEEVDRDKKVFDSSLISNLIGASLLGSTMLNIGILNLPESIIQPNYLISFALLCGFVIVGLEMLKKQQIKTL